jgi:hypothetical protein
MPGEKAAWWAISIVCELGVLCGREMFGFDFFLAMTKPRQLYFFSTSRAMTMRMTSDAPSVIMRLR